MQSNRNLATVVFKYVRQKKLFILFGNKYSRNLIANA